MRGRSTLVRIGLLLMVAVVVNRVLALHESALSSASAEAPDSVAASVSLPGTIIVAQHGELYSLSASRFTEITSGGGWSDPAAAPGGRLLAVQRGAEWSDIVELSTTGSVEQQLTHDEAQVQDAAHIGDNHWAFDPRVGADGRLYFAYDSPKSGYQVDLAIWSAPFGAVTPDAAQQETTPQNYTGGDTSPVPLSNGSLLYVASVLLGDGTHTSQLWWQQNSNDYGHAVTTPADHCAQPAVSPDGAQLAMICSPNDQEADIVIAPFDAQAGTVGTLRRVVTRCLCAAPAWSPDGRSLVYMAPSGANGFFQLWWLGQTADATPRAPVAITSNVDLDATSQPLWLP